MLNAIGNLLPWEEMQRRRSIKISTCKIKKCSGKWFIINRNNAKNMHLL